MRSRDLPILNARRYKDSNCFRDTRYACLSCAASRKFRVNCNRPTCMPFALYGKSDLARSYDITRVASIARAQNASNHFSPFVAELELVKLPEDITLAGFTPLMLNPQEPCYVKKTEDMVSIRYFAFESRSGRSNML